MWQKTIRNILIGKSKEKIMHRSIPVIVISCIVILCCCLLTTLLLGAGLISGAFLLDQNETAEIDRVPGPTPVVIRPDAIAEEFSADTLTVIKDTVIPVNDLLDLAQRLEGKGSIPATLDPPAVPPTVGSKEIFWVTDTDTNESFEIEATLGYITEHTYFWIENEIQYKDADLKALAETFEKKIYPTNRDFFGSEWSPGVDGDPHLYILFAQGLGYNLAGYFSSADEYHPLAHEYSNAHETFVLNADNLDFDDEYTYSVLAHEFQHMIHWYQDRNETSWLNEGFSELAAFLNGYDAGGFDYLYTSEPDLQLNDWPNDSSSTSPHYGASFLFVTYFLDRFGESVTQDLVGHPANGMTSIDTVLSDSGQLDPLTNNQILADDVFLDWTLANYLRDENISDGRFAYHNYPDVPGTSETETVRECPAGVETRDVHQYGVDLINITCQGDFRIKFEGSTQVKVVPSDPYSGSFAFWSNRGDESDMTLTRSFDFGAHSGPLTLTYWTWYDIEADYDYVYLEGSLDGEQWDILTTPSGTGADPSGNSFGWGYNGLSGGDGIWIQEKVDISQFAGKQVQFRFEYVTDAAVNGEGFLLDDIAIPEIDYFSDFEVDSGGWESAGFVRIQNFLPQTYRLALIINGKDTQVEYLELNADNTLIIPISIGSDVGEVLLVVTGTTRYTRQKAPYRFEILP
jgi:immune inhibitor A